MIFHPVVTLFAYELEPGDLLVAYPTPAGDLDIGLIVREIIYGCSAGLMIRCGHATVITGTHTPVKVRTLD